MPLRNIIDRKLETMSDELFDEICKSIIRGICMGAAIYFIGMVALYFIFRG